MILIGLTLFMKIRIQNNIISAHLNNIDKLLFLGSSCIYPKLVTSQSRGVSS